MPIRFACPSCQQPIEVDDQWAGQSVGCPYCKRVIAAPQESTWPSGQIPMATPAGGPFSPPPPPAGFTSPSTGAPRSQSKARRAIRLILLSIALWLVASFVNGLKTWPVLRQHLDPGAGFWEAAEKMQDLVAQGKLPVSMGAIVLGFLAVFCALAGFLQGIRALVGREPGRGKAAAACILGLLLMSCEGLSTLNLLASAALRPAEPHQRTSAPAGKAPRSTPDDNTASSDRT